VRLQLLDKDGKILTKDGRPGGEPIPPVLSTIVLDDTRPEGIRLAPVSKAIRNRLLTVSAVGTDPESGIARVLFFLGEPPAADGKPAPGGRVVEGVPPATPDGPFTAELQMPDRTGRIPIGVRFINNVGLFQDVVDEVEVTDPPPKPTTGTIKVTVGQGSPVRPQSGLEVQLRDEKNAMILKTGKTNEKGEYTFEDVAPGKYVVYSSKPADFSKAQSPVTVEAGKTETVTLTIAR
jgi:hypothetical protein